MVRHPFYIVDVFTGCKYAGNQLAVIGNALDLSDGDMQKIAREMNFSETTFISGETHGGAHDVRIFTPEEELSFAGHPTLGTAFVLRSENNGPIEAITLNLKVGPIEVKFNDRDGTAWMGPIEPEPGRIYVPSAVAEVLGIKVDDIDTRYPLQCMSIGFTDLIVPLRTLDCLKNIRVDAAAHRAFMKGAGICNIMVFCPETRDSENDLSARVFTGYFGLPEDPATGSTNACLAAYLSIHSYFGSKKVDARVEQGYDMGRPSLLMLHADEDGDGAKVFIGGKIMMIVKGELA